MQVKQLFTDLHEILRSTASEDMQVVADKMTEYLTSNGYRFKDEVHPDFQWAVDAEQGDITAAFYECINSTAAFHRYAHFANICEHFIEQWDGKLKGVEHKELPKDDFLPSRVEQLRTLLQPAA